MSKPKNRRPPRWERWNNPDPFPKSILDRGCFLVRRLTFPLGHGQARIAVGPPKSCILASVVAAVVMAVTVLDIVIVAFAVCVAGTPSILFLLAVRTILVMLFLSAFPRKSFESIVVKVQQQIVSNDRYPCAGRAYR